MTSFAPPPSPGPLERDFEAYYAAGATVDRGGDPYSRDIWTAEAHIPGVDAARDELLPYVGPAAALPVWALLARFPYRVAVAMWTAILIGAYLIVVAGGIRLSGKRVTARIVIASAALAIAAAPMAGDLALGQAALISAAAITLALLTYRARSLGGAVTATFLAAVQPNLALAMLGRLRSRWDVLVALTAAIAFVVLTFIAGGGAYGFLHYLGRLAAHGNAERFTAIQHTPAAVALAFGASPSTAGAIGILIAFAAIATTAAIVVREQLDATTATLLCCAALPLATPFFHEHDFVITVLPLLVLALRARGRARTLAAMAAVLVLVDWFGLAQRLQARDQIVCLGLAVVTSFIAAGPERSRMRREWAGFVTLAAVSAVAIPLGHAHPAPTWPAALPAAFHAAPQLDVSEVWAAEQRAAGLDALQPAWGALRGLPLTGCALLGIALIADSRDRRRGGP